MRIQRQHSQKPRAICYSRLQGFDCTQRSTFLEVYEQQVGGWLAGIDLPDDIVEQLLAHYAAEAMQVEDPAKERRRLEASLKRMGELYQWGDIERSDYIAERERIRERLRMLAPEPQRRRDIKRLVDRVALLRDTWTAANQLERNKIAVELIQKVVIKDDQVVEIVPRPDLAMILPNWTGSSPSCGSDGIRTRGLSLDRAAC